MDFIDVDKHRKYLLNARAALQKNEEERQASAVELDQAGTGRLSRIDALQSQAMAKATQQRAAAELRRIEAALARCDSGDYGFCLSCEQSIDPRRLAADPATPLCLRCAEARERR